MRGILLKVGRRQVDKGITPAHAGNTGTPLNNRFCRWDHPRACGEYILAFKGTVTYGGSPPRMRGIQWHGKDYGV